jgi:uncharacterized protein YoxC
MAPAKKGATVNIVTSDEDASLADICRMLKQQGEQQLLQGEQLAKITCQMSKVDLIEAEVKDLKTLMVSLREENKELKADVKQKDAQLDDMQKSLSGMESRLNNLEQHHRGWGARVLNIPLSQAEESNTSATIEKVFDLALRPILEGAVREGKLPSLPLAAQVLEMAHVLPGKPGFPKPIIMRFFSRQIRNICFQFKRDFAEREPGGDGGGTGGRGGSDQGGRRLSGEAPERRGRFRFPLYDDLTKQNLTKMRSIAQDERVQACWTVNGSIRFKLKDSDSVRKVVSVMDPLEMILK